MKLDSDLQAVQEVRHLLQKAKHAQQLIEKMTQEQIDTMVRHMAEAAEEKADMLAQLAVEETGFGRREDKKTKNSFASRQVYEAIKSMKTVGILNKDEQRKVWDIAQPVGVVAGIVPSTNPTSTVIFKALIAVKARNAIVFSAHPAALRCSLEATHIMQAAALAAGGPPDLIQCITQPMMAATEELMKHKLTNVILATGGSAMVKAAYSSGKPAYGVGPGNVPSYIHASAKLEEAVRHIVESKTFDYGTICASEQAIVVDAKVKERVMTLLRNCGAYFLNAAEKEKVGAIITIGKGLNPNIVGKPAKMIASMAGITVPPQTSILIAEETEVGREFPFSIEKLSPILALYTVRDWREGCELSIRLLQLGGMGHTLGLHCEDIDIIEAFGLEKPASRIAVNTGTTFGGIGASTDLFPSMTLGCGSYGNNITSDNIGPQHLMNIKRVAFGVREMELTSAPKLASVVASDVVTDKVLLEKLPLGVSREDIEAIVKSVLKQL